MESKEERWTRHPTYEVLQSAIETLNAGLLCRSAEGKVLYANDRMREWLGYTPEELDGQDVLLLMPRELREAVEAEMREILEGDERARVGVLQRKDGRTFPVVTAAHVLRDRGDVLAVVAVFMDLGDLQTARRVGAIPAIGLAANLERIAGELQTISLFSGVSAAAPETSFAHPDLAQLSVREREILAELLGGVRVPAIAKKLCISPHTVRNHLKSMYRKLDVSDQGALIERVRALAGGSAEG